ncbi:MAG: response regulator [Burkholderiaceae bacterium]
MLRARSANAEDPAWLEIAKAHDHAEALTNHLRAFGRRLRPRLAIFALETLFERLHVRHSARLAEGSGLQVSCAPPGMKIEADARLLEYALDLLLDEAGHVAGSVGAVDLHACQHRLGEISAARLGLSAGEIVHVMISDRAPGSGPGRAASGRADDSALAFEPLVTPARTGLHFGLAWAVADGVIAAHDGRLWAEPIGLGVRLHMLLPQGAQRAAATPRREDHGLPILVVDDERLVRFSIVRVLESAGYEVLTADRAGEALQILAREPVSLVLLDMNLPDMTGEACLRAIRESRPQMPVIGMSGMTIGPDHPLRNEKGVRTLEKPFLSAELLALVETMMMQAGKADARVIDTLS